MNPNTGFVPHDSHNSANDAAMSSNRHDDTIAWARTIIAQHGGTIPSYGTPEWELLPLGDPRILAATILAAECWWDDGQPEQIALRVRAAQLAVMMREHKTAEDAHFRANAGAHRAYWAPRLAHMVKHPPRYTGTREGDEARQAAAQEAATSRPAHARQEGEPAA